jgi:hypothetical protein
VPRVTHACCSPGCLRAAAPVICLERGSTPTGSREQWGRSTGRDGAGGCFEALPAGHACLITCLRPKPQLVATEGLADWGVQAPRWNCGVARRPRPPATVLWPRPAIVAGALPPPTTSTATQEEKGQSERSREGETAPVQLGRKMGWSTPRGCPVPPGGALQRKEMMHTSCRAQHVD